MKEIWIKLNLFYTLMLILKKKCLFSKDGHILFFPTLQIVLFFCNNFEINKTFVRVEHFDDFSKKKIEVNSMKRRSFT